MNWKGFGRKLYDLFDLISQPLLGGTEENHRKHQLGEPTEIQKDTRIQVKSLTAAPISLLNAILILNPVQKICT
jgi:hypothetical protein